MRVDVWNADQSEHLGQGTLLGRVDIELVGSDKEFFGCDVLPDVPKIQLDSGGIVYGYECWWHPVESTNGKESP